MSHPNSTFYTTSLSQIKTKHIFIIVVIILFSSTETNAQATDSALTFSPLSGALPPLIKAENSPYIVETDIFVSPGTTVAIDSGVVLLFNNFTGLHIQGTLYAKGTTDKPIVFTSKNDSYYNPYATINAAPYDWNGIDIYENAIGTYFNNSVVQFSVYGIRSQTEHFKISNSRFLQNGKTNISIKENILDVKDTLFSYTASVPQPDTFVQPTPPIPVTAHVTDVTEKQHSGVRNILRYSGIICALGGIATGILEFKEYNKAKDKFNSINQRSDYNKLTYTSKDWEDAHNQLSNKKAILWTGGGIGLLGMIAFSVSFTF
jgi:hypothetical protein